MTDPTAVVIVIAGVVVTPFVRTGSLRIDDVLNDQPNTAALTMVVAPRIGPPETGAFAPHAFDAGGFATADQRNPVLVPPPINTGAPIQIYLGAVDPAAIIFGGQITTRDQYAELDVPRHVRYDLTCIDWSRRLNRRKVVKDYGQQSATAIVLDMIATFAPGITTANVGAGLPTITGGITFTFEDMGRALSRVAEKIGAYWYVDYLGDLHFFVGADPVGPAPAPIVPGADFANFKVSADLTQVRTRVIVEGDGATAMITLPAGDQILPVSQTTPFNPAGGRAKAGPTRITYGAINAGGAKANTVGVGSGATPPPSAPSAPSVAVAAAGSGGSLVGGPYTYALTFELSDGSRSDLGAPSGPVTIGAVAGAPPTSAALFNPPKKGPIAVGTTSTYATTFLDAKGAETAATVGGTQLTGRAVSDPPGQMFYEWTSGSIEPGWYQWAITFLTPNGETLPAFTAWAQVTTTGYGAILWLPVPTDTRVTGRRVYRSSPSGSGAGSPALPWRHVADVPYPTTDRLTDSRPGTELAARTLPTFNSAIDVGEGATVTLATSPDPRIVKRRLYRKDGAGEYRGVAEIPDNTTTTFNDVVIGQGGGLAPTTGGINTGAVNLSNIPIGPAGTSRRRIFRTAAGGTDYREVTAIANNTATTYTDTTPDSGLGGSPLPSQGGPGAGAPPTAAGSTSLHVSTLAGFPSSGWVTIEENLVRYTGTTAAGDFYLVGIPASGPGSIGADILSGTVVETLPILIGVSPLVAITLGDAVQLIAQIDDVPAQSAIAAVEGGDGVIEHYIQDRRLSESGATARGRAELELFKTIETRVSLTTHDPNARTGQTLHIDLPAPTNMTGDFLIQRVRIDAVSFAKGVYPRRTVDASTTRFSFDDVLNRILIETT